MRGALCQLYCETSLYYLHAKKECTLKYFSQQQQCCVQQQQPRVQQQQFIAGFLVGLEKTKFKQFYWWKKIIVKCHNLGVICNKM